jgi:hypothetical protein
MNNNSKNFLRYHIYEADDLTPDEKIEALEGIEILSQFNKVLSEAAGDEDVANYYKHRNKLRKVGLRKGVVDPKTSKVVASKAKVVGTAGKNLPQAKSFGAKIAAAIKAKLAIVKSAMSNPHVVKGAKVAAKIASN